MKKGAAVFILAVLCLLMLGTDGRADQTVTVTFTGDVTLGSEEIKKNQPGSFHDYAAREGYGYFFRNFLPLFSSDDLTVVNLEGVLSDSDRQENKLKTYRFRGPAEFAEILNEASIEACSFANNHMMDFGTQGYRATLRALDEHGISHFGNNDCFIYEKNGVKIAFFALVSSKLQGSRDRGRKTVARLREEEGVNAVVVCVHAGTEYDPHRNKTQVTYAEFVRKYFTADLVIMHHPHVLQGIDILDGCCYVCYSLGNFCFGGNMKIRALETMAVQADLVFSDDGAYLGQRLRLYPAHIASSARGEGDANDYLPKPVTGDEALAVLQLVQNDTGFDLGQYDDETGYAALGFLPAATAE